jgi:ribosome-binding factor A
MTNRQLKERKIAQKEAQYLRELSTLLVRISLDEKDLASLHITRVKLSDDKGHCSAYIHDPEGETHFKKLMKTLILYKPSIRKSLSQLIPGRYTPEINFKYDTLYDKQRRIDDLIRQITTDEDDTL